MPTETMLPPQNLDAESGVLGSMFLRNESIDEVAAIVQPGHFYVESHQVIFAAMVGMWSRGLRGIDAVTLAEELDRQGKLEEIGGVRRLLELAEAVPLATHAAYYAGIVRTKHRQRTAIAVLTDGLRELYQPLPEDDVERCLATVETGIHRAIEGGLSNEPRPIAGCVADTIANLASGRGGRNCIPTGFQRIDQTTGGIGNGKVVVLAARTSHGKTAFVCSLAVRLARQYTPVLLASYEQGWQELTARLLAISSRVDLSIVETGQGDAAELQCVADAADKLARLPIHIDDSQRDETALCASIRLMVRKRGVRVVIVDYLQLVEPRDRKVIREQQVAGVSRSLKKVAMETGCCIVLLSQLNRGVEYRDDKRPRLADLRESGAIEQDADQVWLLHRPAKGDPEKMDDFGELIIAKNRSGPTGNVGLSWNARLTEFSE